MALPETMTFAAFARHLHCSKAYVTQLRAAERLVLTENNKRVRVAESIKRINDTKDPSKAGVVKRHAEARNAEKNAPSSSPPAENESGEDAPDPNDKNYQTARAKREHFQALSAERDYNISIGKLLDAAEVCEAIGSGITTLRTRLESLPDTLGPQLAAITDEGQVRAVLAETIEHTLAELARQFQKIGKQEGAT